MILISQHQTEGRMGMIDDVIPAHHDGPPLHYDPRFDDGFYLVEGDLVFRVDDEVLELTAGQVALAPRGIPHTFANRTDRDARVVMFVTPGGFEQYFAEGAANARPPDQETVVVGARLRDMLTAPFE
ncbi:MAG: cupin domain-containing protein [Candidatus Dormibacteraceae bacterium]